MPSFRSYIIERREAPTSAWARVAALPVSTKRYTVPDLDEGREYRFRITTETHEGKTHTPLEFELPIMTERRAGERKFKVCLTIGVLDGGPQMLPVNFKKWQCPLLLLFFFNYSSCATSTCWISIRNFNFYV